LANNVVLFETSKIMSGPVPNLNPETIQLDSTQYTVLKLFFTRELTVKGGNVVHLTGHTQQLVTIFDVRKALVDSGIVTAIENDAQMGAAWQVVTDMMNLGLIDFRPGEYNGLYIPGALGVPQNTQRQVMEAIDQYETSNQVVAPRPQPISEQEMIMVLNPVEYVCLQSLLGSIQGGNQLEGVNPNATLQEINNTLSQMVKANSIDLEGANMRDVAVSFLNKLQEYNYVRMQIFSGNPDAFIEVLKLQELKNILLQNFLLKEQRHQEGSSTD
jgi:hypothetical protein